MSEVRIPHRRDEMDEALYEWERAIDELTKTQMVYLQKEAFFKSWEASQKLAFMKIHKMSATMAESEVRAKGEWVSKVVDLNEASVNAEEKKRLARLAEAKWETERSRQVTLRNVR